MTAFTLALSPQERCWDSTCGGGHCLVPASSLPALPGLSPGLPSLCLPLHLPPSFLCVNGHHGVLATCRHLVAKLCYKDICLGRPLHGGDRVWIRADLDNSSLLLINAFLSPLSQAWGRTLCLEFLRFCIMVRLPPRITLSCSVMVLRHTRMGQIYTSLVAIMGFFCVNSASGTKAELLIWTAHVGMIGGPSSALDGALTGT